MTDAVKHPNARFDGDVVDPAERWGWLGDHSDRFDAGVTKLKVELDKAFKALAGDDTTEGDPTNPAKLADYQTALSGYTTYRTLQSNSAKSLSDMQKQNARNLG